MSTNTLETPAYVPAKDAQDVFDKISGLLQGAGHTNSTAWINGMVANYGEQVKNETPDIARFVANSYWCYALGLHSARTGVDTSNARLCIEDRCGENDWYELFQNYVAPAIVKFGL